jgi:hypothetical protein
MSGHTEKTRQLAKTARPAKNHCLSDKTNNMTKQDNRPENPMRSMGYSCPKISHTGAA